MEQTTIKKSLMQTLLDAGYSRERMYNWCSDLYIYVTPLTEKVLRQWYEERGYFMSWFAPTFRSQVDGKLMYNCAFAYDPWWEAANKEEVM